MNYRNEDWDKAINLTNKIKEMRDTIVEEFDMLEFIEDNIKDIFQCDLNCATCSNLERAKCMQHFKKANLLWLRKISQDEWYLRKIVEQMNHMADQLDKMHNNLIKIAKKFGFEYDKKIKPSEEIGIDDDIDQLDQYNLNKEILEKTRENLENKNPNFYT